MICTAKLGQTPPPALCWYLYLLWQISQSCWLLDFHLTPVSGRPHHTHLSPACRHLYAVPLKQAAAIHQISEEEKQTNSVTPGFLDGQIILSESQTSAELLVRLVIQKNPAPTKQAFLVFHITGTDYPP